MNENNADEQLLLKAAHALSNPVRLAIIRRLAGHGVCFHGDMAEVLPVAPSTLSQHLKVLRDAGIIKGEIDPPRVKYCLDKRKLEEIRAVFNGFLTSALSGSDNTC